MDSKKLGAIIVVAVIVVAVGLFLKSKFGGHQMRDEDAAKMVKRVDVDTLDVIELSVAEWQKQGSKDGRYKSPKSGKFSMVAGITCASCGALIPPAEMPSPPKMNRDPSAGPPDMDEFARLRREYEMERAQAAADYMCPHCGDPAYAELGLGGR